MFHRGQSQFPIFLSEESQLPIGQVEMNIEGKPLMVIHPSRETAFFEEIRELLIQGLTKGVSLKPILTPTRERKEDMLVVELEDDYVDIINRAKELLIRYINMQLPSSEFFQGKILTVWFCKTLQNWKAIMITDLPDNIMYEITHNGEKNETYIDTYEKKSNYVFDGS
jgi:hypothetical protein